MGSESRRCSSSGCGNGYVHAGPSAAGHPRHALPCASLRLLVMPRYGGMRRRYLIMTRSFSYIQAISSPPPPPPPPAGRRLELAGCKDRFERQARAATASDWLATSQSSVRRRSAMRRFTLSTATTFELSSIGLPFKFLLPEIINDHEQHFFSLFVLFAFSFLALFPLLELRESHKGE